MKSKYETINDLIMELYEKAEYYKKLDTPERKKAINQSIDNIIELTELNFEEKSRLRHYWRGLINDIRRI